MTQHHGPGHHEGVHGHRDEAALADLLDLDAQVLGSYLDEVTAWIAPHAPEAVGTVVDVGAGTGVGSLALARRFGAAEVVAVDRSPAMLDRVRAAADAHGIADRVRVVPADLDVAWPQVGAADLVWAASSLHEVADPDRVFGDIFAALKPGGVLVVVEMDALPRFLPDDVGLGRPGLEARCHEALARAGWNAHPDWRPHLERAGFEVVGQRSFVQEAPPAAPDAGRYAQAHLRHVRAALEGHLAPDDLRALDRLLADGDALSTRRDLVVPSSRTAWMAAVPEVVRGCLPASLRGYAPGMSGEDKIANKGQELIGHAEEKLGKATGDRSMEAEGKGDQAAGNLKQAGEKVKDAFK